MASTCFWGGTQPPDSWQIVGVVLLSKRPLSEAYGGLWRQKSHWRWISRKNGAEISVVYYRVVYYITHIPWLPPL